MNIGDRARMLRGKEEGIITKIIDSKTVELEIEDGFAIPVLRNEIVVISKTEQEYFGKDSADTIKEAQAATNKTIRADTGIFLAYLPVNDQQLSCYLINNSDWTLPFTILEEHSNDSLAEKAVGVLAGKSKQKIGDFSLQGFENWPVLVAQILYSRSLPFAPRQVLQKRIKPKAATFFKSKQQLPILEKEGFLIQLDGEAAKPFDPQALKEALMDGGNVPEQKTQKVYTSGGEASIDLHAEVLFPQEESRPKEHLLGAQMKAFEQALDQALEAGAAACIFIHGLGNGVLRNEIHKALSKHPHVKYFEDAQKGKFGYGATRAIFK